MHVTLQLLLGLQNCNFSNYLEIAIRDIYTVLIHMEIFDD